MKWIMYLSLSWKEINFISSVSCNEVSLKSRNLDLRLLKRSFEVFYKGKDCVKILIDGFASDENGKHNIVYNGENWTEKAQNTFLCQTNFKTHKHTKPNP